MTSDARLHTTLPRSLSLNQADDRPLRTQESALNKIEALPPARHQKSASFNNLIADMRSTHYEPFQYGNIADTGLTRLVSGLPNHQSTSHPLTPTKQKYAALTELSIALDQIDHCQKIGLADSTTGAHCAMNENYDALFMVKTNDECFLEFIGNCIAEKLELPIPGFALVDHATEQYSALKEKLSSNNPYPCMLSEYREAVNLKEVDRDSKLNPIESFKTLGKAFILDLVIGNWDRFPVFPADDQGNYGNLMYEPSTQQLLFIDIVAMKHTEQGGYQKPDYFHLTSEKTNDTLHKIAAWLQPKFPQLSVSEETTHAFHQGMETAKQLLSEHESSFLEIFQDIKIHLQSQIHTYEQKTVPTLLKNLKEKLSSAEEKANQSSPEEALLTTIQARISHIITDQVMAEKMNTRIISGGLPQIGPLAAYAKTLKADLIFKEAWDQYSQITTQQHISQAQHKILHQIENPEPIIHQLDQLLENIKKANLSETETGQQLIAIYTETETLTENIKKLDMMINSFQSINSNLKLTPLH